MRRRRRSRRRGGEGGGGGGGEGEEEEEYEKEEEEEGRKGILVTSEAEIRCLPFQGSQIRGEYSRHTIQSRYILVEIFRQLYMRVTMTMKKTKTRPCTTQETCDPYDNCDILTIENNNPNNHIHSDLSIDDRGTAFTICLL